ECQRRGWIERSRESHGVEEWDSSSAPQFRQAAFKVVVEEYRVTVALALLVLPARSLATAVMRLSPSLRRTGTLKLPPFRVAVTPFTLTDTTPVSSLAVPVTVNKLWVARPP